MTPHIKDSHTLFHLSNFTGFTQATNVTHATILTTANNQTELCNWFSTETIRILITLVTSQKQRDIANRRRVQMHVEVHANATLHVTTKVVYFNFIESGVQKLYREPKSRACKTREEQEKNNLSGTRTWSTWVPPMSQPLGLTVWSFHTLNNFLFKHAHSPNFEMTLSINWLNV